MTPVIGSLSAPLLQREELIAEIDESRVFTLAAQLEVKQAAVECQRLFDVADHESDVVETDSARFLCFEHGPLHDLPNMWCRDRAYAIGTRRKTSQGLGREPTVTATLSRRRRTAQVRRSAARPSCDLLVDAEAFL